MATPEISLNRFHDALETYRAARVYAVEHGISLVVAESDYNIAYLHYCAASTRAPSNSTAPRGSIAKSWEIPIIRACATWTNRKCTWS